MTYNPNIPDADDFQDDSQAQIKTNFSQADSIFDVDHYKFSDVTLDKGKHTQVTTPDQTAHPTTGSDEPKFYCNKVNANLGALQYSRGGSDAVPTPLTNLHHKETGWAGSATLSVLNCTGLDPCIIYFYGFSALAATNTRWVRGVAFWDGTGFVNVSSNLFQQQQGSNTNLFRFREDANVLGLQADGAITGDTYWTINIERLG